MSITAIDQFFLEALKMHLSQSQRVDWQEKIEENIWRKLFQKASNQHVFPMVYDAVRGCPAFAASGQNLEPVCRRETVRRTILQVSKTEEFLKLYRYLNTKGIRPIVVKGIICRNLYPQPDYRMSGDEDLVILRKDRARLQEALRFYGMQAVGEDSQGTYDIPYKKSGSPLYLEVHQHLFPPDSVAYGGFNRLFNGFEHRIIQEKINGVLIDTMGPDDHVLYLICHAFKHFMHSGFGIRQVCDLALYANHYGETIDWDRLWKQCKRIRANEFAAALLDIGQRYLGINLEKANLSANWKTVKVDSSALLEDLLSGGIYGAVERDRQHSSNITLAAVEAYRKGKKGKNPFVQSAFPPRKDLEKRYPILRKAPVLLPFVWGKRLFQYGTELKHSGRAESAVKSIQIGNQRVELLKKYHIID